MSAAFRDFSQRLSDEAVRYGKKAQMERGIDGLINVAIGEALMRAAHMAEATAIATEAGTAETVKQGSVHEGAGRKASPTPGPHHPPEGE